MNFSIGEEIKKRVKERGMTNVAFAEKMAMEERSLYHFFKKKEMTLDQLLEASKVLDYDFINLYIQKRHPNSGFKVDSPEEFVPHKPPEEAVKINFSIGGNVENISKHLPSLIEIIHRELEKRGLHLV